LYAFQFKKPPSFWLEGFNFPQLASYFVMSKTKLTLDGPKDAQGTTFAKLTPGFVKSQTPEGKTLLKRLRSAALKATL
jgi:hypothetical protein